MRRPVATGTQSMIGETAEVVADFTGRGRVRYGGELWNARSDTALRSGDLARIVRVEGLTLWVEPTARAPCRRPRQPPTVPGRVACRS